MTTTRTSTITRRSFRGAALALLTGAGIALSPLAASASVSAPAAAVPLAQGPVAASTALPVAYNAARSDRGMAAARVAMAQRGKPYVWGGTGPRGFDCSGLVQSSFAAAGKHLPRTSRAQSRVGHPVSLWNVRAGDLIFYYSPVGHVGIYLGYGMMVHSSTYGQPVSIVPVWSVPGFNTARRVV